MSILATNYTPVLAPSDSTSFFITFEGTEGAGKTSLINQLSKSLEQEGKTVTVLREPGGTVFGEKLREAVKQSQLPLAPLAEAYLFASSRAQLLHEKILPILKKSNQVILLDRFIDSSLVYQGYAGKLGMETVLNIHSLAPLNYIPHLTLYLKISLETSLSRQTERGDSKDYFEQKSLDFFKKIIEGHDHIAKIFPQRIKIIQAEESLNSVHQQALKLWEDLKNEYC